MKVVGVTLLLLAAALADAWMLMIGVALVHATWIHALPTIGYGAAFALTAVTGLFALVGTTASHLINHHD